MTTNTSTTNPTKPFTGNFQLQTKIRVIIQEVLSATIRKLSVFNEKIDKFDDYFMVYKEKVQTLEKGCAENKQAINIQFDQRMKLKKDFTNQIIKNQESYEKNNIQQDQIKNQIKQVHKTLKQIHRQNQNLNNQLSKTKGKFLEYSNVISALKQQVSWKITKYIEQTAETNTEIKINNEQMKKQYFNVTLMLEKQKQKYDKIIQMNENQQNMSKRITSDIQRLEELNKERFEENRKTLEKLDQYDTILQAKLKTLDGKLDVRITELENDNKKAMNAVKKLETFNDQLQEIKTEQQMNQSQVMRKIDQTSKRIKDENQVEIVKLSKQLLKTDKTLDKKINQLKEASQKTEDFLTQKIEFMKMQIENEISSQTNQLKQQKQNSSKVNSSTMQQVNARINKFNIEVHKQISKSQNSIKQVKSEIKKQLQNFKEVVQTKMQNIEIRPRNSDDSQGGKVSPELLNQIQQFSKKIGLAHQRLDKKDQQILIIKQNQNKTQIFQRQMVKKFDTHFKQQEEQISGKVQKIMFLVTKMRGDGIIRNQFNEKQIKQIKRNHKEYQEFTNTILKLMPAFGQCINLILALIYDAEYQHSKIIQDHLPVLKKDQEKFNTILEGVLYQFKEKKKAGMICYRHKDMKKTQIVKATFNAYIKTWQQIYENQFKTKAQFLPKGFYKKAVQKSMTTKPGGEKDTSVSPSKQTNFYQNLNMSHSRPLEQLNVSNPASRRQSTSQRQQKYPFSQTNISSYGIDRMGSKQAAKSLKKIEQQEMIKQIKQTNREGMNSNENMSSSSFHIRKKKAVKKDEVLVMSIQEIGQKQTITSNQANDTKQRQRKDNSSKQRQ